MVTLYYEENPFENGHLDYYKNVVKIATHRIKCNKNWIGNICGSPGNGKSEAAVFLAEKIQEQTIPDKPFTCEQIVFSGTDFLKLIIGKHPLPKGSVIVWDEIGIGMNGKRAMSALNIALNNVFQIFRSRNYVFISTTPDQNFIDKSTRKLMHFSAEAIQINFKEGSNKVSINTVQYNPKVCKTYYHNIKVKIKGQPQCIMPVIHTQRPSKALLKQYLKKKEGFNNKIYKNTMESLRKLENIKPLTDKQEKVYEMNQQGLKQEEIAKALSKSQSTIKSALKLIEKKGYTIKRRGVESAIKV